MDAQDIAALFASYRKGRELSAELDRELLMPRPRDEWLALKKRQAAQLNALYEENCGAIRAVLSPLLVSTADISDEIYDALFDWTQDMYYEDYDDPFSLRQFTALLLPHYEAKQDTERLIFLYVCTGYASLEISRTGDRAEGRRSVRYFKKVTSFRSQIGRLSPSNRKNIFVAYSNLIRTENAVGNLTMPQVYRIWQQFRRFVDGPKGHLYDAEIPQIPALVQYIDDDFRTYCADTYREECEKRDGTMRAAFDSVCYRKLLDISMPRLREQVGDEARRTAAPDVYCIYKHLQACEGQISWDACWKAMDDYHRSNSYAPSDDEISDEIAMTFNPLQRLIASLCHTSLDTSAQEKICERYCAEAITLCNSDYQPDFIYAVNNAMENLCFHTRLLSYLHTREKKEQLILDFIVSRHAITYIHSLMVGRAAQLMLSAIFRRCPESLIGVFGTKSARDVLRRQRDFREYIFKAARFHDIGKNALIGIITTEHRKINDMEFSVIKRHPEEGARYLARDPDLRCYRDVALGHHKFYNGKGGYPASFDNTASRYRPLIDLIALCDCLDAATDNLGRNFHRAKTIDAVLAEFHEAAGIRYNPVYVQLMCDDPELRAGLEHLLTVDRGDVYYSVYQRFFFSQTRETT